MKLDTGKRLKVFDSLFVKIREDRDRGGGCCDFSVATIVEQSGIG